MSTVALGNGLKTEKMPGHWVLARLGKRVLRPGGMELTRRMLKMINVQHGDDVVEFAPGMGITARLTLGQGLLRIQQLNATRRGEGCQRLPYGERQRCLVGSAAELVSPMNAPRSSMARQCSRCKSRQ